MQALQRLSSNMMRPQSLPRMLNLNDRVRWMSVRPSVENGVVRKSDSEIMISLGYLTSSQKPLADQKSRSPTCSDSNTIESRSQCLQHTIILQHASASHTTSISRSSVIPLHKFVLVTTPPPA